MKKILVFLFVVVFCLPIFGNTNIEQQIISKSGKSGVYLDGAGWIKLGDTNEEVNSVLRKNKDWKISNIDKQTNTPEIIRYRNISIHLFYEDLKTLPYKILSKIKIMYRVDYEAKQYSEEELKKIKIKMKQFHPSSSLSIFDHKEIKSITFLVTIKGNF